MSASLSGPTLLLTVEPRTDAGSGSPPDPNGRAKTSRILIVEDEPGTRLLLESNLRDLGHEVVAVETGASGLGLAREQAFDLFLVDIHLGEGIDGFEVCRRLSTAPQSHGTPVVLVTGRATRREDLHRGYEAGCAAYLLKTDIDQLNDVVRAMLRMKVLQDDLAAQNRLLEERNRRLKEERERGAELEAALRDSKQRAAVLQELASGHPDGLLLVDGNAIVRWADRGAQDLLARDLVGKNLGSLAPATGLEAFVRDAQVDLREGFRLDLPARAGRGPRSLICSVAPFLTSGERSELQPRVVLLQDAGRRRMVADLLSYQDQGPHRRELGVLLEAARETYGPRALVGESPAMLAVREAVGRALLDSEPILIRGPAGSGKTLTARVIHYTGGHSGFLVPVDCGALSHENAEAELFGYVKGALPEAWGDRAGLVQQAHLGTLFLAEVGALPSEVQGKLLRLLKQGEVQRVGSSRLERVEARVVATTSGDLEGAVKQGRFDAELLAELRTLEIALPPLVERREDVRSLAERFLARYGAQHGVEELSSEALWALEQHDWPGNVQELAHVIERACLEARGPAIQAEDLPPGLGEIAARLQQHATFPAAPPRKERTPGTHVPIAGVTPPGLDGLPGPPALPEDGKIPVDLDFFERWCLLYALRMSGNDKMLAAKMLGIGKSTLYRKLGRHQMM